MPSRVFLRDFRHAPHRADCHKIEKNENQQQQEKEDEIAYIHDIQIFIACLAHGFHRNKNADIAAQFIIIVDRLRNRKLFPRHNSRKGRLCHIAVRHNAVKECRIKVVHIHPAGFHGRIDDHHAVRIDDPGACAEKPVDAPKLRKHVAQLCRIPVIRRDILLGNQSGLLGKHPDALRQHFPVQRARTEKIQHDKHGDDSCQIA